MAEEKVEPRETTWRHLLPWTELFRGFQVALDLNKLALAAAGILAMAFGWWLLALLFRAPMDANPPQWPGGYAAKNGNDNAKGWEQFKQDRDRWNLLHETAGLGPAVVYYKPDDVIDGYDQYQAYSAALQDEKDASADRARAAKTRDAAAADLEAAKREAANAANDPKVADAQKRLDDADRLLRELPQSGDFAKFFKGRGIPEAKAAELANLQNAQVVRVKPYAALTTWPWFEERGPNPFLMATGQLGKPWEVGHFWEWLLTQQAPVLVEPIVKLIQPVVYFFNPTADFWCRLYFLCVVIWTVVTWSIFGGAITRIAAVQVARGEKIGLVEALNFTRKRILSYVTAPLFPLLFIFVLLVAMVLFGLPYLIPIFGDIVVAGVFWPVMIVMGLLMAIALVGLVGWPLMAATVSAEGTDSWEAVSRAYSYVYQRPWHFIWYSLVALVYGAVVVFFIGFMGSLTIYLAKWGLSQTPGINAVGRQPEFLFAYAPTSYGWRGLLLQGANVDGARVVDPDGRVDQGAYDKWVGRDANYNAQLASNPQKHDDRLAWWNLVGAFLVAVWLWIAFLLILGFSYSYFWSASTIIYMLLRRDVDAAEMDEVYLDEDEADGAFGAPLTTPTAAPAAPSGKPGATSLTMVDAPSLRPAAPAPATVTYGTTAPPLSSPVSPEAAALPTPPPPAEDGGATRTEVGATPTEPRP